MIHYNANADPSLATLLWAAEQVVRQHTEPASPDRATGHCAQCRSGACALADWAYDVVEYCARRRDNGRQPGHAGSATFPQSASA